MRIAVVHENPLNESIAVTEIAGDLRAAGHRVRLLLEDLEPDIDAELRAWNPRLVLVPCQVGGHRTALRQAARVRRALPQAFVLLAGTHATFHPELARLPQVDAVCIGEADRPLLELADALAGGGQPGPIPGLARVEGGRLHVPPAAPVLEDLDARAMPDRDLYYRYEVLARFPVRKFATGRGCVHACAYCWNRALREMTRGRFVRRKSPERAVAEIRAVVDRYPTRTLLFSDDLFTLDPGWLEAFAPRYAAEVGLPFTCNSSVERVTPRTVRALARAGCRAVAIGVETGNEELRRRLLNKPVRNRAIREAADLLHRAGLRVVTFNMLGAPGETVEDAFATIALNRAIGADHVRVTLAVPLPHTEMGELARAMHGWAGSAPGTEAERQRAFRNLFLLFRLAVHLPPAFDPLLRRLVRLPTPRLLAWLALWTPYEEKRILDIPWTEGLRFWWAAGDPGRRTANYVTLP